MSSESEFVMVPVAEISPYATDLSGLIRRMANAIEGQPNMAIEIPFGSASAISRCRSIDAGIKVAGLDTKYRVCKRGKKLYFLHRRGGEE